MTYIRKHKYAYKILTMQFQDAFTVTNLNIDRQFLYATFAYSELNNIHLFRII